MALPVTIPNEFANATASIPLSQLDANFNTLANAVNGISDGSETLANVTATVGNITTVNATTVDTTNIEVTNIKAKDGTAAVVLTDSTGAVAVSTPLTANGGVVFNDAGADVDFRVEGDTEANLLFVDASTDQIGIGTNVISSEGRISVEYGNANVLSGTGYRALTVKCNSSVNADQPGVVLGYDSAGAGIVAARTSALGQPLAFWTYNGSAWGERMRIDSSGNLLVGTTTPTGKISLIGNSSSAAMMNIVNQASPTVAASFGLGTTQAASASAIALAVQYGNGSAVTNNSLFIYTNGNVVNTNNSYGAFSDVKLKENITDVTPKLENLNKVRVVNYNLKDNPDLKQIGVIAQELEQIFPGMVSETPDCITVTKTREVEAVFDDEGNEITPATTEEYTEQEATGTTTKSVKYSVFVPMLIKAIQELKAELDAAKERIAALENA